jgi:hypothetical protein
MVTAIEWVQSRRHKQRGNTNALIQRDEERRNA